MLYVLNGFVLDALSCVYVTSADIFIDYFLFLQTSHRGLGLPVMKRKFCGCNILWL